MKIIDFINWKSDSLPSSYGLNCYQKCLLLAGELASKYKINLGFVYIKTRKTDHTLLQVSSPRLLVDPFVGFLWKDFNFTKDLIREPDIKFACYNEVEFLVWHLNEIGTKLNCVSFFKFEFNQITI